MVQAVCIAWFAARSTGSFSWTSASCPAKAPPAATISNNPSAEAQSTRRFIPVTLRIWRLGPPADQRKNSAASKKYHTGHAASRRLARPACQGAARPISAPCLRRDSLPFSRKPHDRFRLLTSTPRRNTLTDRSRMHYGYRSIRPRNLGGDVLERSNPKQHIPSSLYVGPGRQDMPLRRRSIVANHRLPNATKCATKM